MNEINVYYNDEGEAVGISGRSRNKKEFLAQMEELRRLGAE